METLKSVWTWLKTKNLVQLDVKIDSETNTREIFFKFSPEGMLLLGGVVLVLIILL
jgi:hypothetical protein